MSELPPPLIFSETGEGPTGLTTPPPALGITILVATWTACFKDHVQYTARLLPWPQILKPSPKSSTEDFQ